MILKYNFRPVYLPGLSRNGPPGFESGNLHNNPYLKSLVMLIPLFPLIFIFCIFVFFSNFAIFSCFDLFKVLKCLETGGNLCFFRCNSNEKTDRYTYNHSQFRSKFRWLTRVVCIMKDTGILRFTKRGNLANWN